MSKTNASYSCIRMLKDIELFIDNTCGLDCYTTKPSTALRRYAKSKHAQIHYYSESCQLWIIADDPYTVIDILKSGYMPKDWKLNS